MTAISNCIFDIVCPGSLSCEEGILAERYIGNADARGRSRHQYNA